MEPRQPRIPKNIDKKRLEFETGRLESLGRMVEYLKRICGLPGFPVLLRFLFSLLSSFWNLEMHKANNAKYDNQTTTATTQNDDDDDVLYNEQHEFRRTQKKRKK